MTPPPVQPDSGAPGPHVIRLGAAWRPAGEGGHARRFHRPTGLEGGGRVWLVVDSPERLGGATLNGSPIDLSTGRADITGRLLPANEIVLATPHEPLLESVRLEIFSR